MYNIGISFTSTGCFAAGRYTNAKYPFLICDFQDNTITKTPYYVALKKNNLYVGNDVLRIISSDSFVDYKFSNQFYNKLDDIVSVPEFIINDEDWYATTLLAATLKKIEHDSKRELHVDKINSVLFTVPDSLSKDMIKNINIAADIAGIYLSKIEIMKNSQAALHYFNHTREIKDGTSCVVDIDNNSVNLSVYESLSEKKDAILSKKIDLDISFSDIIYDLVNDEISEFIGYEISEFSWQGDLADYTYYKLLLFSNKIKESYLKNPNNKFVEGYFELNRDIFKIKIETKIIKERIEKYLSQITNSISNELISNKISIGTIKNIVVIGEDARVPFLHGALHEIFKLSKIHIVDDLTTNAASMGAAMIANSGEDNKQSIKKDRLHEDLGILIFEPSIQNMDIALLAKKNAILPVLVEKTFKITRQNQNKIFTECRFYRNNSLDDSNTIATINIELPDNMDAGYMINVAFKYSENGKFEVIANDDKFGRKLNVEVIHTESSELNLLKQASLLKSKYLVNTIKSVKTNVI